MVNNRLNSRWIVQINASETTSIRLLCFAYAGGGVSAYARWMSELPSNVELCIVHLPGRESRLNEPSVPLEVVVSSVVNEFVNLRSMPTIFFAHSMGNVIALEVARALRRLGKVNLLHYIASGLRAPQSLEHRLTKKLYALSDAEFVQEIQYRYGGIPKAILDDPDYLSLFVPALRADIGLLESYKYQNDLPLSCDLTIFSGTQDATASQADMLDWRTQASGRFQSKVFSGGHFFIHSERAQVLLELGNILRAAADIKH